MTTKRTVVRAAPAVPFAHPRVLALITVVGLAGGLAACESTGESADSGGSGEAMSEPAGNSGPATNTGATTSGGRSVSGNPFIDDPGNPNADTRSPWATGGAATAGGGGGVQQGDTGSGVTSGSRGGTGPQSNAAPFDQGGPAAEPGPVNANETTVASHEGGGGGAWIEPAEQSHTGGGGGAWSDAEWETTADEVVAAADSSGGGGDWSTAEWDAPADDAVASADDMFEDAVDEATEPANEWSDAGWSDAEWSEPSDTIASQAKDAADATGEHASNEWVELSQATDSGLNEWNETPTAEWSTADDEIADAVADTTAWGEGTGDEIADTVVSDATEAVEADWPGELEYEIPEPPADPFATLVDATDDPRKANAYRAANYMTGSFSSAAQAAENEAYFNVLLRVAPIWRDRADGPWLYVEQATAEAPSEPYRQRVYRLTPMPSGGVRSDVYRFPSEDTSMFAGAWANPYLLDSLAPSDLVMRDGCSVEIFYNETNDEFSGSTIGDACGSTWQGAAYATSVFTLDQNGMSSWDRGFDGNGEQVWGAEEGPYVFVREN